MQLGGLLILQRITVGPLENLKKRREVDIAMTLARRIGSKYQHTIVSV
jgi:hypothetical protein